MFGWRAPAAGQHGQRSDHQQGDQGIDPADREFENGGQFAEIDGVPGMAHQQRGQRGGAEQLADQDPARVAVRKQPAQRAVEQVDADVDAQRRRR